MADQDDDDWTLVRYGNRRRRNRPSYASVTRRPPPRDLSLRSVSFNRHDGGRQPLRRRQRYDREDSRSYYKQRPQFNKRPVYTRRPQYDRRPRNYQRTQYNSRFREREAPTGQWWRPSDRHVNTTRRVQDRSGPTGPLSTDPDFITKVRIIYKLIQAVHHLHNVSQDQPPVTINRMTHTLSTFIKPAAPSDNTLDLITGNAKNWALTSVLILKDHYSDVIEQQTARLLSLSSSGWKEPLNIAANWARRRLGRRLLPETVQRTEALLIAGQADREATTAIQEINNNAQTTAVQQPVTSVSSQGTQLTVAAQVHSRPAISPVRDSSTPTRAPPTLQIQSKCNMATMTDPQRDWSISPASDHQDEGNTTPGLISLPSGGTVQLDDHPREQRSRRDRHAQQTVTLADEVEQEPHCSQLSTSTPRAAGTTDLSTMGTASSSSTQLPSTHTLGRKPTVDSDEEDLITLLESSGDLDDNSGTVISALQKKTHQPQISFARSGGATTDTSYNTALVTPHTPVRRPTRHINTLNKIKNWSLAIREKWLILGDSNVSRFPPYKIANLQIDSFPGATFRHMQGVLAKINLAPTVESVILSLGINNRNQMTQTSIKELQRLLRTTKLKFPNAEIWVPLISFSRSLPQREQSHLHALNKYISSNYQCISELSRSEFSTERDGIHWTHATAARLLRHWTQQGN